MSTDQNKSLKFAFVGDLCLSEEFIKYAEAHSLDYLSPFNVLKPVFSGVDIGVLNLEGPIYRGDELRPNVSVHLSNHHSVLDFCLQNNFRFISLANNHVYDFGTEGATKTKELIKGIGLVCAGIGKSVEEAEEWIIFSYNERKIGFMSVTSDEPNVNSVVASFSRPGCASFLDVAKLCEKVKEIKNNAEILCVSIHWGNEYYQYPSINQVNIAHCLVDAGANYVIGHHPHVVQGIEMYKGGLILYSLGNFFFPQVRSTNGRLEYQKKICKEMLIVISEIDGRGPINYKLISGKTGNNYKLIPNQHAEHLKFMAKIEQLSKPLSSSNYNEYWLTYQAKRSKQLVRESLVEAFKKGLRMSLKEVLTTVAINDLKRNFGRLIQVFRGSR